MDSYGGSTERRGSEGIRREAKSHHERVEWEVFVSQEAFGYSDLKFIIENKIYVWKSSAHW